MSKKEVTLFKLGFPVFTLAALALLILKLVGFEFSWLWIPFVWLFPLWLLVAILATVLVVALAVLIPVGIGFAIWWFGWGRK